VLVSAGWKGMPANGAAMFFGAEINFVLGCTFTWRDRHDQRSLGKRWIVFHCSIAATATLNMLVFALAQTVVPALIASACGIAVAALGNFLAGDRLVFRRTARTVFQAG
jgi:putative flippase GtrA